MKTVFPDTNSPLVSVIIPAYNAEKLIGGAIQSVFAQTYKNWELVVVDDGSTDGTAAVIQDYARRNSRVQYFHQENKGSSAARNRAIQASRGIYVAFLDADDLFLPEKLERQVSYLESNPACDISYCGVYHFWEGSSDILYRLRYEYPSGTGAPIAQKLLSCYFMVPVSAVLRRSVFDRFGYFNEEFWRAEDLDFLLRVFRGGGSICYLATPLAKVCMRKEGNNQSLESLPRVKQSEFEVLRRFFETMNTEDYQEYHAAHFLKKYRRKAGLACLANGDKRSARKYFSLLERFLVFLVPGFILMRLGALLYYRRRDSMLQPLSM